MRSNNISFRALCAGIIILFTASCKPKPKPELPEIKGTYFSVYQFIQDQFKTYYGQPYSFSKTVVINGKKDSSFVNLNTIDWESILKPFIAADIGDKKYIGHYNFNMFEDATTETRNFFYEAIDKDLFTRRFQVSADPVTNHIVSIYIETDKKTAWGEYSQKLFYRPLKYIQIQKSEKNRFSPDKEERIEYEFL